uniref:Uncharacterized protein n=1 Tax=Ficedula albicollis TaxID=59894 RepID=A0A803VYZ6_FICAL
KARRVMCHGIWEGGGKGLQGRVLLGSELSFPPKVPTYEDVPDVPVYATVSQPRAVQQEESIHYADIQLFCRLRSRQLQNATEYATLNFPRARLKYDSKNGTLV